MRFRKRHQIKGYYQLQVRQDKKKRKKETGSMFAEKSQNMIREKLKSGETEVKKY